MGEICHEIWQSFTHTSHLILIFQPLTDIPSRFTEIKFQYFMPSHSFASKSDNTMTQGIRRNFFRGMSILSLLLLSTAIANAQYKISGTVVSDKGKPVRGANVYLENTIDGGTTDSAGVFRFTTSEVGNQTIIATEVSYENAGLPVTIAGDVEGIVLKMKAIAHNLGEVVITAGSFDASNDKAKTVLKPLDIVTTAGAGADVVKAIQMLPGTQQTGADNGLFVRGGDASEAAIVVDEMIVQNAFMAGPPGVSTRSRFGAFNYQGVSFSSGGYSARYGQALSSVLELNTIDLADKSNVNLGINMAGLYASGTKKWKNSSLDIGGNYSNTTPFFSLATTNFKFYEPPSGGGGNIRYVWKPNKNGILKVSLNSSFNNSGIAIQNPNYGDTSAAAAYNPLASQGQTVNFATKNKYYYSNASYKQMFKIKYSLFTAASYSLDDNNNSFGPIPINQQEHRAQFRIEGKIFITGRMNLLVGTEVQNYGIKKDVLDTFKQSFSETVTAGYAELEWIPINMFAVRPGLRYEHSNYLNKDNIAPRLSMAVRTSTFSQVSLAGGIFYQNPDNAYMLAGLKPGMQQAIHYIANWQYIKNDRTLRLEGYYKTYADLIRELNNPYNPNSYRSITSATILDNSGHGYAQGFELFWRDKKTFKNVDYWVSYSYIDTRRLYGNFKAEATPTFIANNNLSLVGKYFVEKLHTNFSLTYSYASGRPYYNPNYGASEGNKFLSDRTPDFHNLAVAVAYLHSFGKWFTVFYISLDNITNQHNVFGYRYSYDGSGNPTQKSPIVPALYRSVFFGVNCSLAQFKKDEL
jgi:hypothetical protein